MAKANHKPRQNPEDLRDAIRNAGLRRTGPRVAVLRELKSATAPLSHGEVAEALRLDYDRPTIYRNLMDLVRAQLVTRRDLGDHTWRFSIVRGDEDAHTSEHPHFLCTDCGELSCLPREVVTLVPVRGVPRSLRKRDIEVQVKGLCDSCQR
jgi:Fur family transcriptional regulator, ferric uptake regulator